MTLSGSNKQTTVSKLSIPTFYDIDLVNDICISNFHAAVRIAQCIQYLGKFIIMFLL